MDLHDGADLEFNDSFGSSPGREQAPPAPPPPEQRADPPAAAPPPPAASEAQQLLRRLKGVEQQLSACLGTSSVLGEEGGHPGFGGGKVGDLRKLLSVGYEQLIVQFPEYSCDKSCDVRVWKLAWLPRSEALRREERKRRQLQQDDPERHTNYVRFVDAATGYYERLSSALESQMRGGPGERARAARKLCGSTLLRLGDLARYREEGVDEADREWSTARAYYLRAAALLPESGAVHNQLAVLAAHSSELEAVYRYVRALSSPAPFPARENLVAAYERSRRRCAGVFDTYRTGVERCWQATPAASDAGASVAALRRSFERRFVRAHGILFTRTAVDEFPAAADAACATLRALLSGAECPPEYLLRVCAVNMFGVEEQLRVRDSVVSTRSALVGQAAELAHGCFVVGCKAREARRFAAPLFAHLRWLSLRPDAADAVDAVAGRGAAARAAATLLCASAAAAADLSDGDVRCTSLPEDGDLQGFSPLKVQPARQRQQPPPAAVAAARLQAVRGWVDRELSAGHLAEEEGAFWCPMARETDETFDVPAIDPPTPKHRHDERRRQRPEPPKALPKVAAKRGRREGRRQFLDSDDEGADPPAPPTRHRDGPSKARRDEPRGGWGDWQESGDGRKGREGRDSWGAAEEERRPKGGRKGGGRRKGDEGHAADRRRGEGWRKGGDDWRGGEEGWDWQRGGEADWSAEGRSGDRRRGGDEGWDRRKGADARRGDEDGWPKGASRWGQGRGGGWDGEQDDGGRGRRGDGGRGGKGAAGRPDESWAEGSWAEGGGGRGRSRATGGDGDWCEEGGDGGRGGKGAAGRPADESWAEGGGRGSWGRRDPPRKFIDADDLDFSDDDGPATPADPPGTDTRVWDAGQLEEQLLSGARKPASDGRTDWSDDDEQVVLRPGGPQQPQWSQALSPGRPPPPPLGERAPGGRGAGVEVPADAGRSPGLNPSAPAFVPGSAAPPDPQPAAPHWSITSLNRAPAVPPPPAAPWAEARAPPPRSAQQWGALPQGQPLQQPPQIQLVQLQQAAPALGQLPHAGQLPQAQGQLPQGLALPGPGTGPGAVTVLPLGPGRGAPPGIPFATSVGPGQTMNLAQLFGVQQQQPPQRR